MIVWMEKAARAYAGRPFLKERRKLKRRNLFSGKLEDQQGVGCGDAVFLVDIGRCGFLIAQGDLTGRRLQCH